MAARVDDFVGMVIRGSVDCENIVSAILDVVWGGFDRIPVSMASATGERVKYDAEKFLFAVDLTGTLLFAIEGATAAISGNLDFLGLMVLAFATALGGGIMRDLLIGAVPPSALHDWHYSAVAFTDAAIVFFLHRFVQGIPAEVMIILDAAGLALFAVAGTQKALIYKMHPFVSILLGTITGVWRHDS
jgi:uncharacterized membrane protein YeiH